MQLTLVEKLSASQVIKALSSFGPTGGFEEDVVHSHAQGDVVLNLQAVGRSGGIDIFHSCRR